MRPAGDVFLCFITGHGNSADLQTANGRFQSREDIRKACFSKSSLYFHPKILIISACRGERFTSVVTSPSAATYSLQPDFRASSGASSSSVAPAAQPGLSISDPLLRLTLQLSDLVPSSTSFRSFSFFGVCVPSSSATSTQTSTSPPRSPETVWDYAKKRPLQGQDELEFHSTSEGAVGLTNFVDHFADVLKQHLGKKSFTEIFHKLARRCLEDQRIYVRGPDGTDVLVGFVPEMVNRLTADFKVPFSKLVI